MLSFWQLNINTCKIHRCLTKQNMLFVCIFRIILFSSVQFSHSVMSDFVIQWTAACQASLSITNSQSLLKLMSIKSVMPSNHLTLCHALLLLPSLSQHQGLFKWASFSYQVAKVLRVSASASILPMNIQDWFPLVGWISLQSKGPSRVFFNTTVQKHQFFYNCTKQFLCKNCI